MNDDLLNNPMEQKEAEKNEAGTDASQSFVDEVLKAYENKTWTREDRQQQGTSNKDWDKLLENSPYPKSIDHKTFSRVDTNEDGRLTIGELNSALRYGAFNDTTRKELAQNMKLMVDHPTKTGFILGGVGKPFYHAIPKESTGAQDEAVKNSGKLEQLKNLQPHESKTLKDVMPGEGKKVGIYNQLHFSPGYDALKKNVK